MIYGVILAGGKGERFWPLSRTQLPKQFLSLTSDKMMLEETIDRILPLLPYENIRIVTNDNMKQFILDNLKPVSEQNILSEPYGRNTGVAIGLAATHLIKEDKEAVLIVLSADHLIKPEEKLRKILKAGVDVASSGDYLITIGVVPTRPETGYGYIKLGEVFKQAEDITFYKVTKFTEKPKTAIAHEYCYSHNYLWNSGIFIWSAQSILKSIEKYRPNLSPLLKIYSKYIGTNKELEARKELYENAEDISVDFAILEKAANVLTIKADIIWDDIGGWNALARYKKVDFDNNVIIGKAVVLDTYETILYNDGDGLIACLGVSDLIIVKVNDVMMIVHKTRADEIKEILSKLKENEDTQKYL